MLSGQGKEVIYDGPTYEGYWIDNKNATNVICTKNGITTRGRITNGSFIED